MVFCFVKYFLLKFFKLSAFEFSLSHSFDQCKWPIMPYFPGLHRSFSLCLYPFRILPGNFLSLPHLIRNKVKGSESFWMFLLIFFRDKRNPNPYFLLKGTTTLAINIWLKLCCTTLKHLIGIVTADVIFSVKQGFMVRKRSTDQGLGFVAEHHVSVDAPQQETRNITLTHFSVYCKPTKHHSLSLTSLRLGKDHQFMFLFFFFF